MNTESSETVIILHGENQFKSGVSFHWKQVISGADKGLWIFKTGDGKIVSALYQEIFVDADIKIAPDLNYPLQESLDDYSKYKPSVYELNKN